MIIYLNMFLIAMILASGANNSKTISYGKNRQAFASRLFLFLLIFLFMGLRYGAGQDYFFTYVPVFNSLLSGYTPEVEIGYILLNKVCILFTSDYISIFILTAFIFVLFIFKTISQYEIGWLFPIYIFIAGGYYFYAFNVMRQCIATAIIHYSLKFIKEEKLLKYILFVLLAASLHRTALIFLPLYFVLNRKYKMVTYISVLVLVFVLRFAIQDLVADLFVNHRYNNYITGFYNDSSSDTITVSQLINIFIFIWINIFEYINPNIKNDINLNILKNIHYVGIVTTLFMGILPVVIRISAMFYFIQFISVPYILKKYVLPKYRLFFYLMFIGIYVLMFANILIKNANNIIPYRFIFQR